jgi:HAD superfamily phosphoserine phosphatase-like hydrolase
LASHEVNAYDFDNTIFRGDSTARFLTFLLRKKPALTRYVFVWAGAAAKYVLRLTDKTHMKQKIYSVFARVEDIDALVDEFWRHNASRVKKFYLQRRRTDDIIISASPEFLLRGICADLGVGLLIASRVDPLTGGYDGANCHGKEKVRRLREEAQDVAIGEFYSDSHSDEPMARIAKKAYIVKGDRILDWQ